MTEMRTLTGGICRRRVCDREQAKRDATMPTGPKVRAVLRRLRRDGWEQVSQEGSHRQFKHPVKSGRVTVAGHPNENLDLGTWKSIQAQAGWRQPRRA